jgi:predicted transcriptional regulator
MKISPAESRVLDVLWKQGQPMTSEEVSQTLADDQEWAHATVRSLLGRLVKKKAVSAVMEGRRYLYRPLIDRAVYARAESESLLDRLFEGRLTPFVTQFASQQTLSPEDIAALRKLVERLEDDQ